MLVNYIYGVICLVTLKGGILFARVCDTRAESYSKFNRAKYNNRERGYIMPQLDTSHLCQG